MRFSKRFYAALLLLLCAIGAAIVSVLGGAKTTVDASTFGVFVGSSPCNETIGKLLQIPAHETPDLLEWNIVLRQDPQTHEPTKYVLHCKYGRTVQGKPGLPENSKSLVREASWNIRNDKISNQEAKVFDLSESISLYQLSDGVLQILNPDQTLMVGTGGWSYTLNRSDRAEPPVDQISFAFQPEMSYPISQRAEGPDVFAVFEGRTPCQGIARTLRIPMNSGTTKAKWRVTLFQNNASHEPTTYKAEGSLFSEGAREGHWQVVSKNAGTYNRTLYRLEFPKKPPILLEKGDDNVLFFLDQDEQPLVGNAEFSYTLNRKSDAIGIKVIR